VCATLDSHLYFPARPGSKACRIFYKMMTKVCCHRGSVAWAAQLNWSGQALSRNEETLKMKHVNRFPKCALLMLAIALSVTFSAAETSQPLQRPVGPGNVFVQPALGGTIFGFDIDQNGTEGLLSESTGCAYATETFDLATGKIIKIVREGHPSNCADDDVTWGITGTSVGLVEHQHEPDFGDLQMSFQLLDPLEGNQFTAPWTPPGKGTAYIWGASRNQSTPINAYQVYDIHTTLMYVYGSDVAGNKFGPVTQIASYPGIVGLSSKTNTAIVFASNGQPYGPSYVNQIDLASGKVTTFLGLGSGTVQGVAVDAADNILVTTTYGDAGVEFYNLTTHTAFEDILPNCFSPACSGFDVAFDPINKLFLVAQPISSLGVGEISAIYVYDTQGNLIEELIGFNFYTQRFDVFPVHIALHPSDRSGFVDVTNSTGVGSIQSFTY
jgi:hypothetical protein